MKYDFDKNTDRLGTNSLKWDVKPDELPLWVADMDFQTAPCVKEAIQRRAEHGIFGYFVVPENWAKSYKKWWAARHSLEIPLDSLIFCTGVVPAISSCVRKLTTPAEKVLVQTPVYNIFFNSVVNNGRFVVESPLSFDGEKYSMDFVRLEKDLSEPQVSLMILCNPHNPCGRIWTREELSKVGSLCKKYGVTVISDEIHCDITAPGKKYVPFASASKECADISVICLSPSKCFNIAGLNSSAVMVSEPHLRHKVWRALNTDEIAEPNAFAVDAAVAAFEKGEDWLNELNEYLWENRMHAESFIAEKIPSIKPVKADSTYLLWVDVSQTGMDGTEFASELRKRTGLFINSGAEYGQTGKHFVRINLACTRRTLNDALHRLMAFCG